jgi:hypothetical protein
MSSTQASRTRAVATALDGDGGGSRRVLRLMSVLRRVA